MNSEAGSGGPVQGHPLGELGMLSAEHVQMLNGRWITTVEELVAACATEHGKAGLAKLLGLSDAQLAAALDTAKAIVGADQFERLANGRPGGPLGALLPDEPDGRRGE